AGGLVRECDDQRLVRRHDVRGDRVRRASADDPGLAGARAGEDRDRPAGGENRLALLRVEVVEERLRVESWHLVRLAAGAYPTLRSPDRIGLRTPEPVGAGTAPRTRRGPNPPNRAR